jgi:hypothetical protein
MDAIALRICDSETLSYVSNLITFLLLVDHYNVRT